MALPFQRPRHDIGVLVRVPDEHVGRVIGKSGMHIRELQLVTGARVFLPKSGAPGAGFREMLVTGVSEQVAHCQSLLQVPWFNQPLRGPASLSFAIDMHAVARRK